MGVVRLKKFELCVRNGDSTTKPQVGFELRLRNNAITPDLQEKICRILVGFDHNSVRIMDVLAWKSTPP